MAVVRGEIPGSLLMMLYSSLSVCGWSLCVSYRKTYGVLMASETSLQVEDVILRCL